MNLLQRIKHKDVKVAVIGLGYVGLPLAVEFASAGFSVTGIDTDKNRVNNVKKGVSYIEDVPGRILKKLVRQKKITGTGNFGSIKNADVIIICVPTPLRKTKIPDISYVLAATGQISKYIYPALSNTKRGSIARKGGVDRPRLIVLESTTYPGTTDELILPILSRNGRRAGRDFFLAYSPERVDPGNKQYKTADIPKVVAGITHSCLNLIISLYSHIFTKVIPVSNTKVAETIKLLENTFRTVNIALVNEIALMCHKMGIDVWDVIKGASTKPFGFMPFYPGPGIGGACLPKDPHYLAWRAKHYDFSSRFIELASDIATSMPGYVVERAGGLIKKYRHKKLKDSRVLILGVAYKKDLGDTRDSPALEIIKILQKAGSNVIYNDPYVPEIIVSGRKHRSVNITSKLLSSVDIAIVTTAHTKYNLSNIIRYAPLVFDTRGVTLAVAKRIDNVFRL